MIRDPQAFEIFYSGHTPHPRSVASREMERVVMTQGKRRTCTRAEHRWSTGCGTR